MSTTPPPEPRDETPETPKSPKKASAPSKRKWEAKDVAILVLGLLLVSLAGYAFRGPIVAAFSQLGEDGEPVKVFEVVVDRQGRQYVDVLFDKPLGEGRVGTVMDPAPGTFEPALGGSWKWQDTNNLRFQPSGRLPVASKFKLTLDPTKILKDGMVFRGERTFTIETDKFLVEGVDVHEEPALEGKGRVTFRGEMKFNYAVDPEVLGPLVMVNDPVAATQPVPIVLETTWRNRVISFRTEAVQKTDKERTIKLVIAKSLTPVDGNSPLGTDFVREIPVGSISKLSVWGIQATPGPRESTLTIRFSSPISAAVAEKYLTIDPAVRVRLSAERNELFVTGAMEPGKSYKVTLGKGMVATDTAELEEDYVATVALTDLEPSADFQSQGMFLAATGNHTVAVETVNVPRLRLAIDRVYLNNLFFLLQYGGFYDYGYAYFGEVSHALGDRLKEETISAGATGGAKNKRIVTPITLDRYVDTKEPGLYRVAVGLPNDWEAKQRWLLLTDLGVVTKRGEGGEFLVWVSSVTDLSPVGDAKVTLITDQNQTVGSGRTDGSGIWRFRDPRALENVRPYMVTVEKGKDFTFLLLDTMAIDTAGLDVGGARAVGDGYSAYLYGERDIYRPGETVKGLTVVRDGALRVPPAMPALLRHRDPQGRELLTRRLDTGAKGHAPFTLELPAYSLTGGHTLEVEVADKVIGSYRFQVEEFVPDRISVEIAPPKEQVLPGAELSYQVLSNYLFGAPAASLPVESRVRLVDSTFSAKGFEGYLFRNGDRKVDDREVLATEGTLDEQGAASFTVTMPEGAPVPSSLQAVITARVSEQGGRGVAALTRLEVHPYPYYIGLRKLGETYPQPNEEVQLEYVTVSPDGKETASRPLRADFFQDRWNTVLKRVPGGGWKYETSREARLVGTKSIPSGKSRGTFTFTPKDWGSYRAVLTDPETQASAAIDFYAAGWGFSPWAMKNPSLLELELDKTEYAPGQTAVLVVKAPFSGKLLVTVERDRVLETRVYDVTGNTARIELPVSGEYRPNAYVTATLVRKVGDLEPGSAGRAFGAVPISVDREANHLAPEIATPDVMRPNRELTVTVKSTPNAVVTVAAVDEGILQLVAQKTPDPFDHFYRRIALGVTSYDTFSLLLPEVKAAPPGGGEGEEGMAQYVRTEGMRRVQPVAFWSGPVATDASGNARVTFKVPEFQGALRVMAVGIDGARFGSSQKTTRVRDPIVLLPTLPRILSFGETFQVPVTVRNDTGKAGKITVSLAASGPVTVEKLVEKLVPASQTIDVPVGREKTVYFTVATGGSPGEARFVITAAGNGQTSKSTTNVGVRADLPESSTETAGGFAQASLSFPSGDMSGYRPESLRRTLRISPLPLIQFSGKLEHLLHYPYGCLEQTTSTAFPLVYLGDLAKALEPELLDPKKGKGDPADMVQAGLRRIAAMQLGNGGFTLWPGGETSHPWGSVYAIHFVVEARKAGHPVEGSLYDRAVAWLAGQVKTKGSYGHDELQRTAYGLYVLARAGKADLGTMDFLREKHAKALTSESRGLLAGAYAAVGNPRAVQELVQNLVEIETVQRQTGANFNSATRNRALLLLALLDAAPKHGWIPKLADRLARDLKEYPWWTTQEEAFALLALGQLAKRQADFPPYKGTVWVGSKKLASFDNTTVAFKNIRGSDPIRVQFDSGYKTGAAYYSLLTRGVPTDAAFKPVRAGLELERQFLRRDGTPLDLANVRQGDLVVIRNRVRSVSGRLENVAVVNLLPSGLEVENPRLQTTEQLPWINDSNFRAAYQDLRDDRILLFTDLPADSWQTYYTLVRAVTPGTFRLPPVQAEAMYDPTLRVTGERGTMEVKVR